MKYGIREVLDVIIFDENGKEITILNTLKRSRVYTSGSNGFVILRDALFDEKLLKFINKEVNNNKRF